MIADLHLPDELSTVNFDTLITDFDSSYGKKSVKTGKSSTILVYRPARGKSVHEYFADLRHSSIDCGVGDKLDNLFKDQCVVGLRSDQIKKKLLEDEDKALADIVKRAQDLELVNRESTSSKSAITSSFLPHQVFSRTDQNRFIPRNSQPESSQSSRFQFHQSSTNYIISMPCYRCGKDSKPISTLIRTPTSSCSNLDLCHMLFDPRLRTSLIGWITSV